MTTILKATDLGISFGGLKAVSGFNLSLEENDLVGLIGPNGAGKTTVFNLLTGVYQPTEGSIELEGHSIMGKSPHHLVKLGIARTFQNIRLFKDITVLDNVRVAFNHQMKTSLLSSMCRLPGFWKEEKMIEAKAMELLKVFDMEKYRDYTAGNLPYGQQRKLEIARALATGPKVLLLDEPAAGMNHTETHELMDTIRFIRDKFHLSILLIEHDMQLVTGICEKLTVLDYGKIIAHGLPQDVINDPNVIRVYLGDD